MNLGLGTVQFGLNYGVSNQFGKTNSGDVTKILEFAQNNHIQYLDTASAYGDAEKVIGQSNLSNFKVITKLPPNTTSNNLTGTFHKSLANLNSNSVYGLLFHRLEDYLKDKKTWRLVKQFQENGKTQKIGFSLYHPDELVEVFKTDCNLIQIPLSLFDRRFEHYLEEIASRGIEIHTRSVFLQGLFFLEPQKLPSNLSVFKEDLIFLSNQIPDNNQKLALLLGYVNQFPSVSITVVGVNNLSQMQEIVRSFNNSKSINFQELLLSKNWKSVNHSMVNPSLWN